MPHLVVMAVGGIEDDNVFLIERSARAREFVEQLVRN